MVFFLDGRPTSCSAISDLAAARIQSVEVLKGPRAIVEYGAQASGGAILILTKPNP